MNTCYENSRRGLIGKLNATINACPDSGDPSYATRILLNISAPFPIAATHLPATDTVERAPNAR